MTNDLLTTADAGSPSLLILLDLTAAFDTVDHTILLERIHPLSGPGTTLVPSHRRLADGGTEGGLAYAPLTPAPSSRPPPSLVPTPGAVHTQAPEGAASGQEHALRLWRER